MMWRWTRLDSPIPGCCLETIKCLGLELRVFPLVRNDTCPSNFPWKKIVMLSKFNGINNQFYANTNLKIGRPHLSRQFSSQFEEKARRLSIDIHVLTEQHFKRVVYSLNSSLDSNLNTLLRNLYMVFFCNGFVNRNYEYINMLLRKQYQSIFLIFLLRYHSKGCKFLWKIIIFKYVCCCANFKSLCINQSKIYIKRFYRRGLIYNFIYFILST